MCIANTHSTNNTRFYYRKPYEFINNVLCVTYTTWLNFEIVILLQLNFLVPLVKLIRKNYFNYYLISIITIQNQLQKTKT